MSDAYIDSCKGKAFAILFFVFAAGMAAGAFSLTVYQRHVGEAAEAAPLGQHQHQSTLAVERLRRQLDLNEAQFVEMQSVLDECIMKEADLLTQLALTRSDGRERIMKILDTEQQQKFEIILDKVSLSPEE
jgi:hypothetical protein